MIKKSRIINEKSKIIPIKIVNTKSEYNTFSNSSNNINNSRNIKQPFQSELLSSNIEKSDEFCSIGDSTSLIFPTLKDFLR